MSSFGALFFGNTVAIATDTLACDKKPIEKDGKHLKEGLASFTSKSIYYPHIQTFVSCLGTGFLAEVCHRFICSNYAISNTDHLLFSIEDQFCETALKTDGADSFVIGDKSVGYHGAIFVAGPSDLEINMGAKATFKRESKSIVVYKLMIYSDRVKKTLLNPKSDMLMYCFHPPLPHAVQEAILDKHEDGLKQNYLQGSESILVDWMKEAHKEYVSSSRESIVAGGEVNIAILNLQETFAITQYTPYRFDDFEECRSEIIDFHKSGMK